MINLLFTPALKAFRKRHPEISLVLTEDTGQAIERQVASGELEIGMTVLPSDPGLGLATMPVASYPIWALGMPGTFRKKQVTINLKSLRDIPLVLLKDDFALTRSLLRRFDDAGFTPTIAAQSGQWDWLVAMASAGVGVALLPEPFIRRIASEPVESVRIVEPEISWDVAQIWNGNYLSHAAAAWFDVCQELLGHRFKP
jgi:DNA-binding transcriptional LysR family regulator